MKPSEVILHKSVNHIFINIDDVKKLSEIDYLTEKHCYEVIFLVSADPCEAKRRYIKDYYMVFASGGIVFSDINEVLLIHRRGIWDLPKGKRDSDETPHECAIREIEEETGIRAGITNDTAYITHHLYKEDGRKIIKETSWFLMKSICNDAPRPQITEEISEVIWANPTFLRDIVMSNTFPLIRELLEKFCLK